MGSHVPPTPADLPLVSSQANNDRPSDSLGIQPSLATGLVPPSTNAFIVPRKALPTNAVVPVAERADGDEVKGATSIPLPPPPPPQYLQRPVLCAHYSFLLLSWQRLRQSPSLRIWAFFPWRNITAGGSRPLNICCERS
jgi:hypothetical protein